jgi:hypothetical protein
MSHRSISIIVEALISLSPSILYDLPDDITYEYGDKQSLIQELTYYINKQLKNGHSNLIMQVSTCGYCHPHCSTYSFHCIRTMDEKLRCVLDVETLESNKIVFSLCRNRPDMSNGDMPF